MKDGKMAFARDIFSVSASAKRLSTGKWPSRPAAPGPARASSRVNGHRV